MKTQITFEDFLEIESKLEILIGRIESAERVPKSYGLKLTVYFGNDDVRTVFTNIGKTNEPESLVGLMVPFITNLAPVEIKGVKSEAMIMVGVDPSGHEQVGLEKLSLGTKLF